LKFEFDSQLYTRYNGAMLGFFLDGAFFRNARDAYDRALRQRMVEFLAELGIEIPFPVRHSEYVAAYPELRARILQEIAKASVLLGAFAALASEVMEYAMSRGGDAIEKVPRQALDFMDKQGIPRTVFDVVATQVRHEKDGSILLPQLHAAALKFVHELLAPLPREPDTAFVAMSFTDSRVCGNFPTLYVPLLRKLGYRAIRAWGGLGDEDYQEAVLALISKCGVLLADITTHSPNVLHEVGFAQSRDDILLLLVAEHGSANPPSNVANMMVFPYEAEGPNWQEAAVLEIVAGIAILEEEQAKRAGPD